MEWKITCCRSDRSHETELNQQIHTRRKVGFCLFYFLCGNSHTGFKQSSLLQLFAWFCTCILPHRKRNCRWTPKSRLCWNALQWKWEAVAKLLPCCCHAKSESKREKVKVRKCCCYAVTMLRSSFQPVAMLLPCKKWKWTWESESEKQLPSCWHVVAMQKVKVNVRKWKWERAVALQLHVPQEELPLNILCRLCCQWKLPSCICRTGNRIAAVQQLKFHFWAGLFSQRLSVNVLIKVLSWIPLASPLTII